jgi:predicted CXXCH cytochrome family protein
MTKPVLRFLCFGSLLLSGSFWAQTRSPVPPAYAGSDLCQPCHDDIYKTVDESGHGELLESRHPEQHGCESCHGPGLAHVSGNGDPEKIFRFSQATPQIIRARCGECHLALMSEDANHQGRSCLDCHSAHHYQQKKFLLAMGKEQLCQRCH